ncbi:MULTISPECIES: iron-sulfur cluster assembly protein IscA [Basfia]|uniref:Iron-binding protein IscA n=2 Tax=Basfia TaxID=697331 RepID=Q65RT0_MANSM|nr:MULTISPECIES: iron-sulfur cluster assembly protein IscA [Basfia]AAU38330.1 IscA protein [[Mannheimia] succiniciproducens MBEL55E]QIM68960.1 iron-sulfur cluster assembly protein IscA [Basfia succiniciproducens]SCY00597.1 Iron-binding apoprotein IscA [Basfia succiniciproducens]SEQ38021.1 Iron-binding apoprotein IscA [Basfia succiniciproducens]
MSVEQFSVEDAEQSSQSASIGMTESAAKHVKKCLESRGKGIGLRLGIKTSGCSGLAYVLEFVDELNSDDNVFEQHGVKVIVDTKSLVYLNGTQLDFVKEGLNEGFKFTNPNVKDQCGCGESFNV